MMMIKKIVSLFFACIILAYHSYGQEMSEGFILLEQGDFSRAEIYFKEILAEHPTNKTAQICYGRAVGLSGNPEKALHIFESLKNAFPNDQEVLLNLAEAHLWQKDPSQAILTYRLILAADSSSFAASLGYANAMSMNKSYKQAYFAIQKAIDLSPDNQQALLSRKFIRLGYANALAGQFQEFEAATALVMENLNENTADQESLQLLTNIQLMSGKTSDARITFAKLKNPLERTLGLSLVSHLSENNTQALSYAKEALQYANQNATRVNTHLISAMLWNNLIIEARKLADSLIQAYPQNTDYLASRAEVAMYEADFIDGYETYRHFLAINPDSFKGNLGLADASHALGIDNEAYKYASKTLDYYPGQQDAKQFVKKLNEQHSPSITSTLMMGKSSDGSSFSGWSNTLQGSINPRFTLSGSYTQKRLVDPSEQEASRVESMQIGATAQVNKRLRILASYGLMRLYVPYETVSLRSDIDVLASIRISKKQTLSLGMQTEVQDFNRSLLSQNLKTTHLVAKNAMNWKVSGIGWYSELYYSFFSDKNRRALLFNSIYKAFGKQSMKLGLNYLTMYFSDQKPTQYFSPKAYHQVELFGNGTLKHDSFPLGLNLDSAIGYQFTDGQRQLTWRAKAALEKQTGRLQYGVSAAYSSIVATQSNGFSFVSYEAKVRWRLTERPLFRVNEK